MNRDRAQGKFEKLKEKDLVDYLSQLGHQPLHRRGEEYVYQSPFRKESHPSFMVNRRSNIWIDFGMGTGGSIIDFCMHYFGIDFRAAIRCLGNNDRETILPGSTAHKTIHKTIQRDPHAKLVIKKELTLSDPSLIQYLKERKIDLDLARKYCRELVYAVGSYTFRGIGFPNDLGGYEIRSPQWKGGNAPKGVSCFERGSYDLYVFEGFIDFLSFLSLAKPFGGREGNYLVLNSLSFFEKQRVYMELHERVFLYLDRDRAGRRYWHQARSWAPHYLDGSADYHGYKDLNDWVRGKKAG